MMTIQRSGPTPPFFEYITSNVLIPHHANNPTAFNLLTANSQWVEIPRYQRGISWDVDNVIEFLESPSILLGNVILAQFNRNPNQFENLPDNHIVYTILVDGLQRFAVGTMILSMLYGFVMTNNPKYPNEVYLYTGLNARLGSLYPVFLHNDKEFLYHPRRAIASQYDVLRDAVRKYIENQIEIGKGKELSVFITNTFLNRQIAIDTYFNFQNQLEVMSTFLGINTVRVDLGSVDLVRSYIVENGTSSGWQSAEVDDIENTFTSIFITNQKPDHKPDPELLPLAGVVLKVLTDNNQSYANNLFPSWGNNFKKDDVDKFLDFIYEFKVLKNNYIDEIRQCGSIPFAIIISYYYIEYINSNYTKPDFFNNGKNENENLHRFLIACYRGVLDNKIGRTRAVAENVMKGTSKQSLSDIADKLSNSFIGIPVGSQVDVQWLNTVLNRVHIPAHPDGESGGIRTLNRDIRTPCRRI